MGQGGKHMYMELNRYTNCMSVNSMAVSFQLSHLYRLKNHVSPTVSQGFLMKQNLKQLSLMEIIHHELVGKFFTEPFQWGIQVQSLYVLRLLGLMKET